MTKITYFLREAAILSFMSIYALFVIGGARAEQLCDSVDPFIGTSGGGNTFPGPSAPFGMVQFSPDTGTDGVGYSREAKNIQGFSLTHMSGVGCSDFGDVYLTATTGPVLTKTTDYESPFSHAQEAASPGYYRVSINRWNISAELTAAARSGMARFTFPEGQAGNILVPISHTLTSTKAARVHVSGNNEIEGQVTSQSFCGAGQTYTVYFVMQFDRPFVSFGTWKNQEMTESGRDSGHSDAASEAGAYVRYPADGGRVVQVRIGISYVDMAGARNNLNREMPGWDFDGVRRQAEQVWEKELQKIGVRGGGATDRKIFYTSLYHAALMPNLFSDEDNRYIGFDNQIHVADHGRSIYANFSGWDIYRTQAPLLALIEPQRLQDMCQSIVLMYKQGGWIDRWPQANTYTNVMCGSPLTTVLATAWNAGLHNFDITTAYEGMWLDATTGPPPHKPYGGQSNIAYMDRIGYIPDDKEGYGSVSQTEENCYSYASLALLADALGKQADARLMRKRSLYYRNLFNPDNKFVCPRLSDGQWGAPFSPTQTNGYVEGTAWEYLWLAPHDVKGLITLLGGDEAFNAKLDTFFAAGHYDPYNEPDLQAPFFYDYSGEPWKTQDTVRKLLHDSFHAVPGGIPGNDDCGTMSAWYLLGAMGLYPTDPARPAFELCSPLFPEVTIHLDSPYKGRKFVITAQDTSGDNRYIQSAFLNEHPLHRPWISEDSVTGGGSLLVSLGGAPNKKWGSAKDARPPALAPDDRDLVDTPAAPVGINAVAGSGHIVLTWSPALWATGYTIKRATARGGPYTEVFNTASGPYTDTGLTNGTPYFYVIAGRNSVWTGPNSQEVSVTPQYIARYAVNCGGEAAGAFEADANFAGGTKAPGSSDSIDTSDITNPAPPAVYQTERLGAMIYTIPGLVPNTPYKVRLHFCENSQAKAGERLFNVAINGAEVLTKFDILDTAGASHKALVREFSVDSEKDGQIAIEFTGGTGEPQVNGIEVIKSEGN